MVRNANCLSFDAARDFGDVYKLTELWNALGFDGDAKHDPDAGHGLLRQPHRRPVMRCLLFA